MCSRPLTYTPSFLPLRKLHTFEDFVIFKACVHTVGVITEIQLLLINTKHNQSLAPADPLIKKVYFMQF